MSEPSLSVKRWTHIERILQEDRLDLRDQSLDSNYKP